MHKPDKDSAVEREGRSCDSLVTQSIGGWDGRGTQMGGGGVTTLQPPLPTPNAGATKPTPSPAVYQDLMQQEVQHFVPLLSWELRR